MYTKENTIGEIDLANGIHIEVEFYYYALRVLIFPKGMHLSFHIGDPADAEDIATMLEKFSAGLDTPADGSTELNVDGKGSLCVHRVHRDDIAISIGRDDDYLDVYLPHLSEQNCQDLAHLLRLGAERLAEKQEEDRERQALQRENFARGLR